MREEVIEVDAEIEIERVVQVDVVELYDIRSMQCDGAAETEALTV